tara:strand:+ start:232 stop:516 length:285 start_codon:yes stop_codon:yes gene_type:complete
MQKNYTTSKIPKKLKHSDPDICTLLTQALKFNPHERWSASEALKMPIFDSVRIKQLEQPASFRVRVSMDEDPPKEDEIDQKEIDYTKSFLMELL